MTYALGHPVRQQGQDFDEHQREMARWMGYANVDELNRDHDPLHAELCQWMGATSFSLLAAQGVALSQKQRRLADLEEAAVLNVQRWLAHLRQEGMDIWLAF